VSFHFVPCRSQAASNLQFLLQYTRSFGALNLLPQWGQTREICRYLRVKLTTTAFDVIISQVCSFMTILIILCIAICF
jgi:hypothetical protein